MLCMRKVRRRCLLEASSLWHLILTKTPESLIFFPFLHFSYISQTVNSSPPQAAPPHLVTFDIFDSQHISTTEFGDQWEPSCVQGGHGPCDQWLWLFHCRWNHHWSPGIYTHSIPMLSLPTSIQTPIHSPCYNVDMARRHRKQRRSQSPSRSCSPSQSPSDIQSQSALVAETSTSSVASTALTSNATGKAQAEEKYKDMSPEEVLGKLNAQYSPP